MSTLARIITVGISPCWDVTCTLDGIEWGEHAVMRSQTRVPAGKALNISRALAWMGVQSTAAGLWGRGDFEPMKAALKPLESSITPAFTVAAGATRENITLVDTRNRREMHLRSTSRLASAQSLSDLRADLARLNLSNAACVFAGALPTDELLNQVIEMIQFCIDSGARVVVDTSGEPLRRISEAGGLYMLKPNMDELGDLLGRQVEDAEQAVCRAAESLKDRAAMILVSRAEKGALLWTPNGAYAARSNEAPSAAGHSVGCGDYLLAGVLAGLSAGLSESEALAQGVAVATARYLGAAGQKSWVEFQNRSAANVRRVC